MRLEKSAKYYGGVFRELDRAFAAVCIGLIERCRITSSAHTERNHSQLQVIREK